MDWKYLFLDSKGRIGQKEFWIGFLILFVAGFVLGMIPLIGQIAGLVLIYPNVALVSKRLHDFGKSGWLAAAPYAITAVGAVIAVMVGGASIFAAGAMGGDPASGAAIAGMGSVFGIIALVLLVNLAFLLWVGLTKGDPAANQYGAPRTADSPVAA